MKATSLLFAAFAVLVLGCGASPAGSEDEGLQATSQAVVTSFVVPQDTPPNINSCIEGRMGPGGCINQYIRFSVGGAYLKGGGTGSGTPVTQATRNIGDNNPDLRFDFMPYHGGTYTIRKSGSNGVCLRSGPPSANDTGLYMGACVPSDCVQGGRDVCEWKFTGGNNPYSGYTFLVNVGWANATMCIESDAGGSYQNSPPSPKLAQCSGTIPNNNFDKFGLFVDYAAVPTACDPEQLHIARFPLNGLNGVDWMINNYKDIDPDPDTKDAMGNDLMDHVADYQAKTGFLARTYDGHGGFDIDLPSMRQMDSGVAEVVSATAGRVVDVYTTAPDRQTTKCADNENRAVNYVIVRDASGFTLSYFHLKANSIPSTITRNATVSVGTKLGVAGSSGCSTAAHLHFEVDCLTSSFESIGNGVWSITPPLYEPASGIMDVMLKSGSVPTGQEVKIGAANPATVASNSTLGIAVSAALRGGDVVSAVVSNPSGTVVGTRTWTDPFNARFSHIFLGSETSGWSTVQLSGATGTWKVDIKLNGTIKATRTFRI
jgi:hypothetical protein